MRLADLTPEEDDCFNNKGFEPGWDLKTHPYTGKDARQVHKPKKR